MQNSDLTLLPGKKIFFASDFHLGLGSRQQSLERELRVVAWLEMIADEAGAIFLMGDLFDYWYEFRSVVPAGFVRFLGTIAKITDRGIPVYFFPGNHDLWAFRYLGEEVGMQIIPKAVYTSLYGVSFYLGHGDGVGSSERSYKLMKACFTNKTLQWLFSKVHPDWNLALGRGWSKRSRLAKGVYTPFLGRAKEAQLQFAEKSLKDRFTRFFVMGHRHLPMDVALTDKSRLIGLGEWIEACTYAVFDGKELNLLSFNAQHPAIIYREGLSYPPDGGSQPI